jgi:hypothetical protein
MTKKEVMTKLKSKFLDPSMSFVQMQKVKALYGKVTELQIADGADVPAEIESECAALK